MLAPVSWIKPSLNWRGPLEKESRQRRQEQGTLGSSYLQLSGRTSSPLNLNRSDVVNPSLLHLAFRHRSTRSAICPRTPEA